jgi:hypothetical protein
LEFDCTVRGKSNPRNILLTFIFSNYHLFEKNSNLKKIKILE